MRAHGTEKSMRLFLCPKSIRRYSMTIYQQELLRKLPQLGCAGQYSEREETLAFFHDGFKIGWQDKAGYIYGA